MTDKTPDTCEEGHDLTELNTALDRLQAHGAAMTAQQIIGDLRCMAPMLAARLSPKISVMDEVGLRTFIGLVQRLDGDPGPDDDVMPPVEGAITGAKCTCHEPDGSGTKDLLNNVGEAIKAHSALHAPQAQPAGSGPQIGGYL